jgi:ABC-type multidrug transport system ATPase subunit
MSERLLKALMQLFAIIARPESNRTDRRLVVESFLSQLLNKELVKEYLKVFDEFYTLYQGIEKTQKRISLSSVKVLKICTAINEELIQKQKVIVLIRLLEFIKSDTKEITEQELEFVSTVSSTFNIPENEYVHIKTFVLNPIGNIHLSSDILIVDEKQESHHPSVKHIYKSSLQGQIWVLNIESTNMHIMRYLGEKELYLNGQLIPQDKVYILTPGSSIRNNLIKPIYYGDIVSSFNIDRLKSRIVFETRNIEFKFPNGKMGLRDINFAEESGHLIGIMGASGAGKSTLLNVLNGTFKPSGGEILINGYNIHTEKDSIEGVIGHVSQDDLLMEDLTVFQNLYYNAKLCFDNFTEPQILDVVEKVLQNLGLYEIKDMKVGSPLNKKISGGQRKRLNIALELIREPAVLFLDEPTSGLSSRDSENIMDLLKELSLKGKLVFTVIHQPSSEIFKMFDRLLILDRGGYLIYNGDPIDSIIYFKSRIQQADWNASECPACGNVNPEQIFNIVEAQILDEYGNPTQARKVPPPEWESHYLDFIKESKDTVEPSSELPVINFKIPNAFRQFKVFVKRDVLAKLSDKQYLFINMLESPILAILLAYIIKYYDESALNQAGYIFSDNSNLPVYLFMSVIVAIFIGLTVSAEEIIADRKILKREEFLHLSRPAYLMSKVFILTILSAIQAFTFVIIGNTIMELKGMYFIYWFMLFSTWVFANLLGLNISDSFKTSVTIYILIPFLVIPQIILSGIIVKFDKLNPNISSPVSIPWYGEIMTARWAYEGLAVYQFKNNKFEKEFYYYEKLISVARYKKDFWLTLLNNKLTIITKDLNDLSKKDDLIYNIDLLRNEINQEIKDNQKVTFDKSDMLYFGKINQKTVDAVRKYFEELREYYTKLSSKAIDAKDKKVTDMQKTKQDKDNFLKMKQSYENESLGDFCKNSDAVIRIMEYEGRLYQKISPVFQDPESKMISAHFYAPRKQVFGIYIETYWVNIMVIWFMIIFMYVTLHLSGLRRLLDKMENLVDKVFPSDD